MTRAGESDILGDYPNFRIERFNDCKETGWNGERSSPNLTADLLVANFRQQVQR